MISFLIPLLLIATTPLESLLECQRRAAGERMTSSPPQAFEFNIRIAEPTFEVDAVYRATRDGRMRIDVFAKGNRVFAESLDGENGWQWNPEKGVSPTNSAGTAALRHGIELPGRFFTFGELAQRGHQLEDLGEVQNQTDHFRLLNVILDDGHQKQYWLDHECRIARHRDFRALHPDVDPTKVTIETRVDDYRVVDGLTISFRGDQYNADNDEWLGTTVVKSVLVDPDLGLVAFDLADLEERPSRGSESIRTQ
jgi:hypothetical protein